ncbi:MAG: MFS transporter [Pirellulaceae bacterium]
MNSTAGPSSQAAEPHKGSLLVIFLTVFVDLLGFGMVLPLLPIYANQFATDKGGWQLGLLMASFSAMQFVFAPMWGRLSDRVGRRPVLMIGLGGSVAFYSLFGVATLLALDPATAWMAFPLLFVSRIGAGIAGATISTAQAYIADSTTLERRPRGMALIGMAFGMGFTFGPLLGFLAVPNRDAAPGPMPGFVAAGLSAVALLLAVFLLPESLRKGSESASRKLLDFQKLKASLATPSIGPLLVAIFVCVFSFANFETTLSLMIKGGDEAPGSPFEFSWRQICLTYAFIGFTLALVQGGVVRRLAGRVSEGVLASAGALIEIVGFLLMLLAVMQHSTALLFAALAVVVAGFSFMQPNLNSMLSRRSDPTRQGGVLGLGQSMSSLARIFGSGLGIPLMKLQLNLPYFAAAGLMGVGLLLVIFAARSGRDYQAESPA